VIGSRISHYKVRSKLGEGGMGEVWRAEDTTLGRDVALKMLPESFAEDPERLERFKREARVLASLSHPNIAGIYDLEETEGKRFLVMEVAEGETLSERIARGPLPVEEAIRIAERIAEALEAAHEKGIVHRDLKPGNVMVTPEGGVKVLDFGLAKAMGVHPLSGSSGQEFTQSPTLAPGMTQAGMLLGTAGYMSPEQARGKAVDRRADIWAFGCVLFEMLGGRRAFDGETVTDVLGAIVHKEPEIGKLPAEVPGRIRQLIGRCLQKEPTRRLQSIGDARVALQEWLEHPEEEVAVVAAGPRGWRRGLPWGVAAALGVVAGGLLAWTVLGRRPGPPEPVRRFSFTLPDKMLFTDVGSSIVLSPDGSRLAYVVGTSAGRRDLFVRPLDRYEGTSLASGNVSDAPYHPFFSPDGEWIGYVTRGELKKVSVTGGASITLASLQLSRGATWGPDGTIVFAASQQTGLSKISAAGGPVTPLTTLDEAAKERSHRWPQWLPGGRAVLFTSISGEGTAVETAIEAVDVGTGKRIVVHRGGSYARYVPTGHILYVQDGTLFALPFDPKRLKALGSQMPVLEGVESQPGEGSAQYDVSETGILVYVPGSSALASFPIVWVDRAGRSDPLWSEPGIYGTPRLSPDGKRLTLSVLKDNNWDVWIYDIERGVATRLTFGEGYDADPVWSPDGAWIAFASDREGPPTVFRKRTDGSGQAERLHKPGLVDFASPVAWSPDGKAIIIQTLALKGKTFDDLYLLKLGVEDKLEPFLVTPFSETDATFSPGGRWVAYTSNETGRPEVYVGSYPPGRGKWQISDNLGSQPRWSRSGRELFYRTADGVMVVEVGEKGASFQAGKPRLLFSGPFLGGIGGVSVPGLSFPDYDATADGQKFVMFAGGANAQSSKVDIVTGWFGELRRLTSSSGR
jgi:Tol biopolymer transport system component/predicted Ser/Thr protein kinase